KLLIKSKKRPNPSRFSVRNFSNPRNCGSSYARPKSANQRALSQTASNWSSKAEKLASRFFALGTTPAVAAGVEYERWGLEQAVEMTAEYLRRKEDAKFEDAFAKLEC